MFPTSALILIVEDTVSARNLLKGYLSKLGRNNTLEAENGQTAVQLITASLELNYPLDLIISDWNMPEMSGLELLQWVRSHPKLGATPFLMTTAEGEMSQVVKAIKLGVTDYIVKPFTAETLEQKMASVWKKTHPGTTA
ncbi:MAG: response regulator [Bdellovibrionota bacterium]